MRGVNLRFLVLWGALVGGGLQGRAAPVLADDFEGTNFLKTDVPPGPWDFVDLHTANTILRSPLAAHRGAQGMRTTDNDNEAGVGQQSFLITTFASTLPGTVSLRFWVRTTPAGPVDAGMVFLGNLGGANVDPDGGVEQATTLSYDTRDGHLTLAGFDVNAAYGSTPSTTSVLSGWHLVETEVRGAGTSTGERTAYVDGVRVADRMPVNFANEPMAHILLGEYYASPRVWVGTLDYDDVRVDNLPQASTLVFPAAADAGTALGAGDCTALEVALRSSSGDPAPAPYAFAADLAATPSGSFYADPSCAGALGTQVSFDADALSTTTYFRAQTTGPVSLSATYVDFITRPLQTSVDPLFSDGGIDVPPTVTPSGRAAHLAVGCGCQSGTGSFLELAVVLFLLAGVHRGLRRG